MFSVKRYVVLTHLICHNCHLAVRSCNPSEPFWDQQRPRGTVWGYGHNSQLARMRNLAYAAIYTCTCIDVPGYSCTNPMTMGPLQVKPAVLLPALEALLQTLPL